MQHMMQYRSEAAQIMAMIMTQMIFMTMVIRMMRMMTITALMQHMVQYRSEAAQYWESSAATTVTVGGGDMSRIRFLQNIIFYFLVSSNVI